MKIIAATDFSPTATNAARTAAHLARTLGDTLLLIRVVEPPVAVYPELGAARTVAFEAALRDANQAGMDAALTLLRGEGVAVEGRVLAGPPAPLLALEGADPDVRLIVMGNQGTSPMARLFLGSVVERTVMSALCPVLVVPQDAAPFDAWTRGRPLRLLVGLDRDAAGDAVVERLAELRRAGACDVTVVHTYWPPDEYARLGLCGPRDLVQTDPDVVAVIERELSARFGIRDGSDGIRLRVRSAWARPADILTEEAWADRADLLVVGTRQPHGWTRVKTGSSALAALRTARTAVLCVPPRPQPAVAPAEVALPVLRSVLCPTDFSDLGNAAIPHAYALVGPAGGTVELCHVNATDTAAPHLPDALLPPLPPARRAALEARLAALVPREAERLGIATHLTIIDRGAPATAILQAARRLGTDAIALASHGRAGLTRALLASVAEEVLRGADRPVFVVRPPRAQ